LTENEFVTESALEKQTLILRAEIATVKTEMIKWTAGMLIAQAAVIVALLELI